MAGVVNSELMLDTKDVDRAGRWPELMTTSEVARLLRVDRSTISRWRASGTGPPVTWLSATTPRYQRAHVLEWLSRAVSWRFSRSPRGGSGPF